MPDDRWKTLKNRFEPSDTKNDRWAQLKDAYENKAQDTTAETTTPPPEPYVRIPDFTPAQVNSTAVSRPPQPKTVGAVLEKTVEPYAVDRKTRVATFTRYQVPPEYADTEHPEKNFAPMFEMPEVTVTADRLPYTGSKPEKKLIQDVTQEWARKVIASQAPSIGGSENPEVAAYQEELAKLREDQTNFSLGIYNMVGATSAARGMVDMFSELDNATHKLVGATLDQSANVGTHEVDMGRIFQDAMATAMPGFYAAAPILIPFNTALATAGKASPLAKRLTDVAFEPFTKTLKPTSFGGKLLAGVGDTFAQLFVLGKMIRLGHAGQTALMEKAGLETLTPEQWDARLARVNRVFDAWQEEGAGGGTFVDESPAARFDRRQAENEAKALGAKLISHTSMSVDEVKQTRTNLDALVKQGLMSSLQRDEILKAVDTHFGEEAMNRHEQNMTGLTPHQQIVFDENGLIPDDRLNSLSPDQLDRLRWRYTDQPRVMEQIENRMRELDKSGISRVNPPEMTPTEPRAPYERQVEVLPGTDITSQEPPASTLPAKPPFVSPAGGAVGGERVTLPTDEAITRAGGINIRESEIVKGRKRLQYDDPLTGSTMEIEPGKHTVEDIQRTINTKRSLDFPEVRELKAKGFSQDEINRMTPEEASDALGKKVPFDPFEKERAAETKAPVPEPAPEPEKPTGERPSKRIRTNKPIPVKTGTIDNNLEAIKDLIARGRTDAEIKTALNLDRAGELRVQALREMSGKTPEPEIKPETPAEPPTGNEDIPAGILRAITEGKKTPEDRQAAIDNYRRYIKTREVRAESAKRRAELNRLLREKQVAEEREASEPRRAAITKAMQKRMTEGGKTEDVQPLPSAPVIEEMKKLGYTVEDMQKMSQERIQSLVEGEVRKNRYSKTQAKRDKWQQIADQVKKGKIPPAAGIVAAAALGAGAQAILTPKDHDKISKAALAGLALAAFAVPEEFIRDVKARLKGEGKTLLDEAAESAYRDKLHGEDAVQERLRDMLARRPDISEADKKLIMDEAPERIAAGLKEQYYRDEERPVQDAIRDRATDTPSGKARQAAELKLEDNRSAFKRMLDKIYDRQRLSGSYDGNQNGAGQVARMEANEWWEHVKRNHMDDLAAPFIVTAGGDIDALKGYITTMGKMGDYSYEGVLLRWKRITPNQIVQYAVDNFNRLNTQVEKARQIYHDRAMKEKAAGLPLEERDNYVPGTYQEPILMMEDGSGEPQVAVSGALREIVRKFKTDILFPNGGMRQQMRGFLKPKKYNNFAEAIKDGYRPRSLSMRDLIEFRAKKGEQAMNTDTFIKNFKQIPLPGGGGTIFSDQLARVKFLKTGKTDLVPYDDIITHKGKDFYEGEPVQYIGRRTPDNYQMVDIAGKRVYVHDDYARIVRALYGHSVLQETLPGKALLETWGFAKHSLLLFDTFHMSRMMFRELFMSLALGEKLGYKRGLTLLEYNDHTLDKMVAQGDIPQSMASWVKENRPLMDKLIRHGLNVGRVYENMYNKVWREIPPVRMFNRWVFEKLTRGAMAESALAAYESNAKMFPELTEEQLLYRTAGEMNHYYGNLMSQGVFKSKAWQEMARMVFLAPQWTESVARTEIKAAGGQMIYDLATKHKLRLGVTTRASAAGVLASMIGVQLVNLAFKGKPTWENETGHKMDAWVPGGKTGFYFSPLAIQMELLHDVLRYNMHNGGDVIKSGGQIVLNKLAPLTRAGWSSVTGEKDFDGRPLQTSWDRLEAFAAAAPTPIWVKSGWQGVTGAQNVERQMLASGGLKVEPGERIPIEAQDIKRDQFQQYQIADYIAGQVLKEAKDNYSWVELIPHYVGSTDPTIAAQHKDWNKFNLTPEQQQMVTRLVVQIAKQKMKSDARAIGRSQVPQQ